MRRINLNLQIAFLLLLAPVGALQAGPVAMWTTLWEPVFTLTGTFETAKNGTTGMYDKANFGKSATENLQATDLGKKGETLPGTSAFARALATATTLNGQDVISGTAKV